MQCLAASSLKVPPTSLRVSTTYDREEIRQELAQEGVVTRLGSFSKDALVVESGSVQASRAFREGRVVIQDEASQLVGQLVAPREGDRVLDLCAAPGIKARQLAERLGRGTLVACDVSNRRLRTLKRLLPRSFAAGLPVHILRLDAAQALPFGIRFERIVVDVPCSGTGTLARNPEIKWRLDSSDLARLAEVQEKILRNALPALAAGGRLVYATCSLEPEENEAVVEKVLREREGFCLLTGAELSNEFCGFAGLFDSRGYMKTRPDLHSTDGFFASVIEGNR